MHTTLWQSRRRRRQLPVVYVLSLCLIYCFCSEALKTISIGGLFGDVSLGDELVISQAEHLAAFLMAVNEINNKTDGVYDDLLPDTTLEFALYSGSSLETATLGFIGLRQSFAGDGVVAVVNTLDNTNALIVNLFATQARTPNIITAATSGIFNRQYLYPYVTRVVAAESRQGMVIHNLVCIEAIKVVVFVSTNDEDICTMNDFVDDNSCELDIMVRIIVRDDSSNVAAAVAEALPYGARYFIAFLPPYQIAALLEAGFDGGLFGPYTVLVTTETGAQNITNYFTPEADIVKCLTGFFAVKYWPNYYINRTDQALDFARRWRQQPPLTDIMGTGYNLRRIDDDNSSSETLLFESRSDVVIPCAGLNFSSYDPIGLDIQPYTSLTYDGVVMLAKALDLAVKNDLDYNDADLLTSLIINNISFFGVSGPIQLYGGSSAYSYDSRGARRSGSEYIITNFNPTRFVEGQDPFMVPVGYFDGMSKTFAACGEANGDTCFYPVFGGPTDGSYNIPPRDTPPDIVELPPAAYKQIFQAMTTVLTALVVVFAVFIAITRRTMILKAAQPSLLWCILLGGAIAAFRIEAGGSPKTDAICVLEVWTGHLAFIIVIGALFVKSYRVHCIVNTNTKSLRRVTFSGNDAFRMFIAMVVCMIIYLSLLHVFANVMVREIRTTVANQTTIWRTCKLVYPQWQTALFLAEAILLAFGFKICWEIRNVPDIVNESKQISQAMSAIVLVSVLILPLVFVLGLPPFTAELIASMAFGFGAITALLLLFVPKMWLVYTTRDNDKNLYKIAAAEIAASGKSFRRFPPLEGLSRRKPYKASVLAEEAEEMFQGMEKQERLAVCHDQLLSWQAILLNEQRAAMSFADTYSNRYPGVGVGVGAGAAVAGGVGVERTPPTGNRPVDSARNDDNSYNNRTSSRFPRADPVEQDHSHPVMYDSSQACEVLFTATRSNRMELMAVAISSVGPSAAEDCLLTTRSHLDDQREIAIQDAHV